MSHIGEGGDSGGDARITSRGLDIKASTNTSRKHALIPSQSPTQTRNHTRASPQKKSKQLQGPLPFPDNAPRTRHCRERAPPLRAIGATYDFPPTAPMAPITVGVLALQGAFAEHIPILQTASLGHSKHTWSFCLVRTPAELATCSALIIPGGESTAISLIAQRTGLLQPLREFINVARKPVWGTCAGLILLADVVTGGGPKLENFGGLAVEVRRNYFGRQVESFSADLDLPFLSPSQAPAKPFHTIFIRAPVVSSLFPPPSPPSSSPNTPSTSPSRPAVEILARLPARAKAVTGPGAGKCAGELGEEGDVVAVRQGEVFGTAFHPELTGDGRIHGWWLGEVGGWFDEQRTEGR